MSATGLDVFDKTLQTTNIWLDEIMQELGPDRQVAWHALGAVLRTLRDRVPLGLAAHLGSQLPILVRGAYYDQWVPRDKPLELRSADEFLDHVSQGLSNIRPVNVKTAVHAVFATIGRHSIRARREKSATPCPRTSKPCGPKTAARLNRSNPRARPTAGASFQFNRIGHAGRQP
jgi:uncharacterized protein (DUF2267 family)